MIAIGELSLWIALLLSVWAAVVSILGDRRERPDLIESGRRAVSVIPLFALVSSAALWNALFSHDLSLVAVASHTTRNLPRLYLFSAFWESRAGSLLFVALFLASVSAVAVVSFRKWPAFGRLNSLLGAVLFLVLLACIAADPFARLDWVPVEGAGLNTRVQDPRAVLHALILYAAYAVSIVSIAATVAAVSLLGRSTRVPVAVRRWLNVGWTISAAAALTGLAWAYREPGLLRTWGLRPVQDGSLLLALTIGLILLVDLRRRDATGRDGYAMRWPLASRVVVVIAAIITAIGIGGAALRQGSQVYLETAGSTRITDWFGDEWMLTSEGFSRYTVLNRNVTALGLHVELNGKRKGILTTEIRHYFDGRGTPLPRISVQSDIKSTWKQDLHVFLTSYEDTGRAGVIVSFNPFAKWIWVGGTLLTLCGLWFFWPSGQEREA